MADNVSTRPLNGEPLITLSQAAARYPGHRGANRVHPATLARWIINGVRALGGERVRLEAIRAFNDKVAADPRVECVMVPISDGLTLLRKR